MPAARATLPLVAQTPAPTASVGTTAGLPTLRAWLLIRVSAPGAGCAERHQAGGDGLFPGARRAHAQLPLHQQRGGPDPVTLPAPDGRCDAGQLVLVHQAPAFQHRAVHGEPVARPDEDDVPPAEAAPGQPLGPAGALDQGLAVPGQEHVQPGPGGAPRRRGADDLRPFDHADDESRDEEAALRRHQHDGQGVQEVDRQAPLLADALRRALEDGDGSGEDHPADQQAGDGHPGHRSGAQAQAQGRQTEPSGVVRAGLVAPARIRAGARWPGAPGAPGRGPHRRRPRSVSARRRAGRIAPAGCGGRPFRRASGGPGWAQR